MRAQNPESQPPTAPSQPSAPAEKPALPFQITLLETRIRFETNGDSRKEVHTVVKINDPAGTRQFSRLVFDYNRAFQQIELSFVRITHANGGTSEILPSAITDAVNPAVEKFPAFHDVRIKSARILGLQEGDALEYRVITTTTKHPLAPDYWLEHTFDRSGQVLQEQYELSLPGVVTSTARTVFDPNMGAPIVFLGVPSTSYENVADGLLPRSVFRWIISDSGKIAPTLSREGTLLPDVVVTSFPSWGALAQAATKHSPEWTPEDQRDVETRIGSAWHEAKKPADKLRSAYDWVSKNLQTVDLPLEATGYRARPYQEIAQSGYATSLEKCYLLSKIASATGMKADVVFHGVAVNEYAYPRPSAFHRSFVYITGEKRNFVLDPALEVAPFGLVPSQFRGALALSLTAQDGGDYLFYWIALPEQLPFPARQDVLVDAGISAEGSVQAKVHYKIRGDNELLLRDAFYKTNRDHWKDVATLLALADGFRGQITSVTASDPLSTEKPFEVEYELTQPKFVDWSKRPVRIPALLPQVAMPDPPVKSPNGAANTLDLGTPLEVETQLSLRLPPGTTVQTPPATGVTRDYATYSSKYSATQNTLTATRRVRFIQRELPADRAPDYNAFLRAVQNDQAQLFTLFPPNPPEK